MSYFARHRQDMFSIGNEEDYEINEINENNETNKSFRLFRYFRLFRNPPYWARPIAFCRSAGVTNLPCNGAICSTMSFNLWIFS